MHKLLNGKRKFSIHQMGLGAKLLFIFILMGSIPLMVSSFFAASRADEAIRTLAFNQLTAVREVKKSQLENYFQKALNDMKVLIKNPSTHNAMDSFAAMFFAEGEHIGGQMWLATVDELGPSLTTYIRDSGYQDLLLVTMGGQIVYSVGEGEEVGRDLTKPPLSNTSLAKAYRKCLKGDIAFSDFEEYYPDGGRPAAFIAGVMVKYDDPIGVAIVKLPRTEINNIMRQRSGMGVTGETYLVGEDKLLRSDSLHADAALKEGNTIPEISTAPVLAALDGRKSEKITRNYQGVEVLSAYSPIKIFDYQWALVCEIASSEAFASIDSFWLLLLFVGAVVTLAVAAAAIMLARSITKPVSKAVWLAEKIRSGDLSQRLLSPGKDEIGQLGEALNAMADDISTKINALNQLNHNIQESELKYRNLFEDSLDAIMVTDIEGQVKDINDAGLQLLGVTRAQIAGLNLGDFYSHPEDRDTFIKLTRRQGVVKGFETRFTRADGTTVEVLLNSTLKRNEKGKAISLETIAHDISERNKAQRALKTAHDELEVRVDERTRELFEAKEAAETANKAKSAFLASMSHELRTPLHAILGYSQIMTRSKSLSPEQRRSIEAINKSGEHLLSLINSVLEMSKIEAGRITVNVSPFDVEDLIQDLEAIFAGRARDKRISLALTRDKNCRRYLSTDLGKLRQILINLLGNAIKYTDKGGISLHLSTTKKGRDSLRLKAVVTDTGIGLAKSEGRDIFEAFEQADGLDARGGTGLGLTISRQYARLMGGDLEARPNKDGTGSTFVLEVDATAADSPGRDSRTAMRKALGLAEPSLGMKVLVVDDEDSNRDVLIKTLASADFFIREAVNGRQAVEMYDTWRPDLILMDIRMPEMGGLDAIRAIREKEGAVATHIIAFSASTFEEDKRNALVSGADDFLPKPLSESELWECLGHNLGLKILYEGAPEQAKSKGVTPEQISGLSPGLRRDIKRAIADGDLDEALTLTGSVEQMDADMAEGLRVLIDKYDVTTLSRLFLEEKRA